MWTARFGMNLHSVPVSAFAHELEMIVDSQIADCTAKVVKETVTDRTGVDDAPGDDWKKRKQIVTAPALEFIAQRRGPVEHFDFPTIGVQIFKGLSRQGPRISDDRFD